MHDTFDSKLGSIYVKEEMTIKRFHYLKASDMKQLRSLESTPTSQVWTFRNFRNGVMDREQITLSNIVIRIFKIPAVLERHVLFRSCGDENLQAHAVAPAFFLTRSITEVS